MITKAIASSSRSRNVETSATLILILIQLVLLLYRLLEQNFYDLISKQANRNLRYKNELSNKVLNNQNKNKTYLVFVTNNKLNFDIFRVYLLFYYVNIRLYKKNLYLGLDFEFNTKVVALMQLNFEQPRFDLYDSSLIFLIDPTSELVFLTSM